MKSAQRARVRVDCQEQKRVGLYWLYCIALNFFLLSYFFSLFSSFVLVLFSFSSCFLCCFFLVVQLQGDECAEGQYTDTLVTNGGCVDCPTGYVSTSNACLALDQKKYRPNVDVVFTEYCKKGHYCDGMNIIPCPPGRSANARQENSCVECDRGKHTKIQDKAHTKRPDRSIQPYNVMLTYIYIRRSFILVFMVFYFYTESIILILFLFFLPFFPFPQIKKI